MKYLSQLLFQWASNHPDDGKNDIKNYAKLFRFLALECKHITELGTRNGISTGAFLSGVPAAMRCYDLDRQPNVDMLEDAAQALGVDFVYTQADTRTVDIEETDLLFVDACHRYSHVSKELKNESKVRRYIVFHDTVECWEHENGNPVPVEGIGRAIEDLIKGGNWVLTSHYTEGSGLMILSRREP